MPIPWPPPSRRHPWRAVRRRLALHRRPLTALCTAAAIYAALLSQAAPPPPTVPVWTAARPLAAGQTIGADDLRRLDYTPDTAPSSRVRDRADVLGRVLARPLATGDAVARTDVMGRGWLDARPGIAAVPVRLTDPAVAGLLRPGDRVDVVVASARMTASGDASAPDSGVIARDVEVISLPRNSPSTGFRTTDSGRLVVIGAPVELAAEVARVAASDFVTVIWTR